ncbi:MAG: hypothetical protein LBQ66_15820, partial [Planctomycetaceae bacterium]|nr:hypothetical protein [Planctomycetaceae bacterium]
MMKKLICILCVAFWATGVFAQDVERVHVISKTHLKQNAGVVSLAGEWRFRLDPDDAGLKNEWYKETFTESINLPGSLQEQGYGNDVDIHTKWTVEQMGRTWYNAP